MKRPSISLSLIAKNEAKNIPHLFASIEGCFDEIVFCDTGSTDGTMQVAQEWADKIKTPIKIVHFNWIKDFAAARNYCLGFVTTDYMMWMDLDDVLEGKDAFIAFRNDALAFYDMVLLRYVYASDNNGAPVIAFARERILKMAKRPEWKHFVHEGIHVKDASAQYVPTFWIKHRRTLEDIQKDKGRNIEIMETNRHRFDSRMEYYYGKELLENNDPEAAWKQLTKAASLPDLELHDRIMALQYACYALLRSVDRLREAPEFLEERNLKLQTARTLAHQGLQLVHDRAEFHCIIGDIFLRQRDFAKALPAYHAAKGCIGAQHAGSNRAGAIFTDQSNYQEIPSLQIAKIFFNTGKIDEALKEAKECFEKTGSIEAAGIVEKIEKDKPLISLEGERKETDEIVFSCPPTTAYEFDEELYETEPLGGSETALVCMAKYLREFTGLPVKVFNMRQRALKAKSGVEYISAGHLNEYMSKYKPKVHIAWRHNIKLTKAKTYLWCHDLMTGGCENGISADVMLCLTDFHKKYVHAMQGIPLEKIIITKNGVNLDKFDFPRPEKNPNKIVWMSSPDRGLDRCMLACDEVRKTNPNIELHVYYGLDNLYKYGLGAQADSLKGMMAERPWVKYHGFTEQSKMYRDVADAAVWLHPCNFIETFCITALEMLNLGIFPITRRLGALANTLSEPESKGLAVLLDHDCLEPEEIAAYAKEVNEAITEKKWTRLEGLKFGSDWADVAKEWIEMMDLPVVTKKPKIPFVAHHEREFSALQP